MRSPIASVGSSSTNWAKWPAFSISRVISAASPSGTPGAMIVLGPASVENLQQQANCWLCQRCLGQCSFARPRSAHHKVSSCPVPLELPAIVRRSAPHPQGSWRETGTRAQYGSPLHRNPVEEAHENLDTQPRRRVRRIICRNPTSGGRRFRRQVWCLRGLASAGTRFAAKLELPPCHHHWHAGTAAPI